MAVWKSATETVPYDASTVKKSRFLQNLKTPRGIVTVRSERGYLDTNYDASLVSSPKSLRRQLGEKYDQKKVRNTQRARAAMRIYWDSSALIKLLHEPGLRPNVTPKEHATRPHALAEVFSTLTKGLSFRYSPQDAARMISDLAGDLSFVELTHSESLRALTQAGPLGVRGGRVHDLLHATAAQKYRAEVIFTLDSAGSVGLTRIEIRQP